MNPTTNDWASADPTQNITLGDADQFRNGLASALAIQFADTFVKTSSGDTISETEMRRNNPVPGAAMNLWGTLADASPSAVNIAEMRTAIRSAAQRDNPVGDLENILRQALPRTDVQDTILRAPAIQAAVRSAISSI